MTEDNENEFTQEDIEQLANDLASMKSTSRDALNIILDIKRIREDEELDEFDEADAKVIKSELARLNRKLNEMKETIREYEDN
jgi:hypothetical protein